MSLSYAVFFTKEKKENLYDIMEVTRNTPTSEIRKAFRKASLKYHPDKNKSPEAYNIYLSLNENMDILKDPEAKQMYDYYQVKTYEKIPKPTAMTGSDQEYRTALFMQKLFNCASAIPFYLAWLFIPLAYLDKGKRKTKFVIFTFIVGTAAVELCFLTQTLPQEMAELIKSVVPSKWTFKEAFRALHVAIPYIVALIIAYFDVYVLKVYIKNESDDEYIKRSLIGQVTL